MPVVASADLMEWLSAPTEDAPLVVGLEKRAAEFVEQQTARFFGDAGTAHEEILRGDGTDSLWLREEADSITSVEKRGQVGDAWEAIVEANDDGWEKRGARLLRKKGHTWLASEEYRVRYTFGYAAGAAPEDIKQLVLDLVKLKYDERVTNLAVSSDAVGPERYARDAFTGDVRNIPWVAETLDSWRWRRVA